jgi:hypothetical protein
VTATVILILKIDFFVFLIGLVEFMSRKDIDINKMETSDRVSMGSFEVANVSARHQLADNDLRNFRVRRAGHMDCLKT